MAFLHATGVIQHGRYSPHVKIGECGLKIYCEYALKKNTVWQGLIGLDSAVLCGTSSQPGKHCNLKHRIDWCRRVVVLRLLHST